jgi:hypothetical protein
MGLTVVFRSNCQTHSVEGEAMKPDDTNLSGNRRKVLKGTLAAPVVLTVSSASATSLSSFGRCMRNLKGDQVGDLFLRERDLSLDTWLRKEIKVVKLARGDDEHWFYLDPGRSLYVRLTDPTGPGISPYDMNGWTAVDYSRRWMLVWVNDDSGKPYWKMQVQRPSGYQATTKSCYSSLMRA